MDPEKKDPDQTGAGFSPDIILQGCVFPSSRVIYNLDLNRQQNDPVTKTDFAGIQVFYFLSNRKLFQDVYQGNKE